VQSWADLVSGVERLLDRLTFRYIALSGGEPLLYPRLAPLIRLLAERGQATILTTNGRLLSNERLRALQTAGLRAVQVSLLGSLARTHDALAGRPSFSQAVRALAQSRAAGLATGATFIATDVNVRELPQVVRLVGRLGIGELVVNELQPVGSAVESLDRLRMRQDTFDGVLADALALSVAEDVNLTVIRSATATDAAIPGAGGWRRWSVSPDGQLKLCNHASRTVGRLADISDERLEEVAGALAHGNYTSLAPYIDNCSCFARAVGQQVRAQAVAGPDGSGVAPLRPTPLSVPGSNLSRTPS
jgi:MoaA/NifB/PqqE/SkfB family radical SAM enzyme